MNNIVDWMNSWTNNGAFSILIFLPFAALLLGASIILVNYSEIIIRKTKFGGAFVGGVFIAATTSIPELITDISQSSLGNAGAASGSDIGSNAFSMFMIAIAAIVLFRNTFMDRFDKFTRITMAMSAIASLVLSLLMYFNRDVSIGVPGKFVIGIIPLLFLLFYFVTLFIQFKWGTEDEIGPEIKEKKTRSVKFCILMFTICAALIIGLSLIVNWAASSMINGFGLPEDGIGGILLAITTSLPEIIAFAILLKRHQPIAGAATLIGSHFFNLAIMFFGDMAYTKEPYFENNELSSNWIIALVTFIGMALLFTQSYLAKKGFKQKILHLTLPSLAAASYIIGWIIQLTLV